MQTKYAQLAEELATTAMEKSAENLLQQIAGWLNSLPEAQRNAIIGSLIGGAGTGAVSAMTDGNVLMDLLLGAGLGASAGYGGTRAWNHIRGNERIPSETMGQNWDAVRESLPPGVADQLVDAGLAGGSVAGAGYGAGKYLESLQRKLKGMASVEDPIKGGVNAARSALRSPVRGAEISQLVRDFRSGKISLDEMKRLLQMRQDVLRQRATDVTRSIATEEMRNTARSAQKSWNPLKKFRAVRDVGGEGLNRSVYERMKSELGEMGGRAYSQYGGRGAGAAGVKSVLRDSGKPAINEAVAAAEKMMGKVRVPRIGRWAALPGAALAGYMALAGNSDA